ncbi:hypothetical protein LMOf6854_1700 [Listeria monocytogenes str. 1/2a F6854]|nr:hypothetical protein LMOf6854_1700 [Listeria monocytogenes str. 1/2a F6854] [Listeria monocytogenes serotype 1/2a str. F6854]
MEGMTNNEKVGSIRSSKRRGSRGNHQQISK